MQNYQGHIVGRLSRAVLQLCTRANVEAVEALTPMPRHLGALGLFRGVAAVAKSLTNVAAQVHKVLIPAGFHNNCC